MRTTHALLVLLEIGGYATFSNKRNVSLQHAEQIITSLMEAVIDRVDHPLTVNTVHGDVALLFQEYRPGEEANAAVDVLSQVGELFQALKTRLAHVRHQRAACDCDACRFIDKLSLKAFVHAGNISIGQTGQFEALTGDPLDLLQRMRKNSVPEQEYVLLSDTVRRFAPKAVAAARPHREFLEGLGEHELWVSRPGGLPAALRSPLPPQKPPPTPTPIIREHRFQNLPTPTGPRGWWISLKRRFGR